MAKLPAFLNSLSQSDGRELATIETTARKLRDAGLVNGGPRGLGAIHLDAVDVASLIMGVLGSSVPRSAIDAVQRLAVMKATGSAERGHIMDLISVPEGETLQAAIVKLLKAIPKVLDLIGTDGQTELIDAFRRGDGPIGIQLAMRAGSANISVIRHDVIISSQRFTAPDSTSTADKAIIYTVTERTFCRLSELLEGKAQ